MMNPAPSDIDEHRRYPLHHILLRSALLADDVLRELRLGAPFEELANEYSACPSSNSQGFAGLHNIEQLPETIRIALLTDRGQQAFMGPVKTRYGFHIIKSCYTSPAKPMVNANQSNNSEDEMPLELDFLEKQKAAVKTSNSDVDADLSNERSDNHPVG